MPRWLPMGAAWFTIAMAVGAFAEDYSLVHDGAPASRIVLARDAGPVEKHAATELAGYLRKVSGADIAVQTAPSERVYNVFIGTIGSRNIPLWIHRRINQAADYRNHLAVRCKVRGRGQLSVAVYQYNRGTDKHVSTVWLKRIRSDSKEWSAVEARYECRDDRILRLAFHMDGEIDIDDIVVSRGNDRRSITESPETLFPNFRKPGSK